MSTYDVGKRPSCKYSHLFDSTLDHFWAVEALKSICQRYNENFGIPNVHADRVPHCTAERRRGYWVARVDQKSPATPYFPTALNGVPRWSKEYKTKKLFLKTLQKHFGRKDACGIGGKSSSFLDSLKTGEQNFICKASSPGRVEKEDVVDDLARLVAFVNKSDIVFDRKVGLYDHVLADHADIKLKSSTKDCSKHDLEAHSKKIPLATPAEHTVYRRSSDKPCLSTSTSNHSLLDIIDISLIDDTNNSDSPEQPKSPLRSSPCAAMKHYFSFFEENCIKVEDIHRLLDFSCDEFAYRPNFLSLS